MAKEMTPTTVMNSVRPVAFDLMVKLFTENCGEENVLVVGDSEISVKIGTAPTGEPIYANYSPTIKNYVNRTTKSKTIKAYDAVAKAKEYAEQTEKKKIEKEEAARKKSEKIEKDKAARAERARKIAEAKAAKN